MKYVCICMCARARLCMDMCIINVKVLLINLLNYNILDTIYFTNN